MVYSRGANARACLKVALLSSCAFALTCAATALAAQSSGGDSIVGAVATAETATAEGGGHLEDIIVTAQRRSESLQDVPLAVTAFSASTLDRAGIASIKDIAQLDPSLNITYGSNVVLPFLRGIGNAGGQVVGNESSVPVYIDDVYYTRLAPPYLDLANVERVEVLKGPQGTLFGRNASGGLVQVFARDPGSKPALNIRMGYGNYDTLTAKLYAATPVTDNLGVDLAVSALHQGDGWGRNFFTGYETNRNKYITLRSKLVWQAGPNTKIKLIGFYVRQHTGQGLNQGVARGTISGTPLLYGPAEPILPLGTYNTNSDVDGFARYRGWGGSLRIDQGLGVADFVSITSYRKAREFYLQDGDGSTFTALVYGLHSSDREVTQELQLKSVADSSFDWIVGGFYLNSKQAYDPISVTGDAFGGAGNVFDIFGSQQIKSYAGYGQATFAVVPEGTNITLGLRYTSDHVNGRGSNIFTSGRVSNEFGQYNRTFSFNKLTYKVVLDHHFNRDVMAFLSFSRGYKSGTFNLFSLFDGPSRPEVVQAYELGVKSELFDRRLRLNVSLFQNDIQSPQVQVIVTNDGVSSVALTNADSAKVRGVEANATVQLTDALTLRFGGEYLDAQFGTFLNAPINTQVGLPTYGVSTTAGDASGFRLPRVPKWRYNIGANYSADLPAGNLGFDLGMDYTSRFPWEADNNYFERAHVIVNSSLTFRPATIDGLEVRLWARNLFDRQTYTNAQSVTGGLGKQFVPGAPRTYGIELGYKL